MKDVETQKRRAPNILITGTPGTGKTTLAERVHRKCPQTVNVNVGKMAKEEKCLGEWDSETQSYVLEDEDRIIDILDEFVDVGGLIVDHHVTDFFPKRYFDAVFVLRTSNTILYDRLSKGRGYSGEKLKQNVEAEIFQTVLEEAMDCYDSDIILELENDNHEHMLKNVDFISDWITNFWKKQSFSPLV